MVMKRLAAMIFGVVLIGGSAGCQVAQVYQGERRPRAQVAHIRAASESVWQTMMMAAPELISVDYTPRGDKVYEVEPGIHRVIVFVGKPGVMGSQIESIYFETEAGGTYKVHGEFGEDFWVEDQDGVTAPLFWIVY